MDECHLSFKFPAVPRQIRLNGLIAGATVRKEGRQARYFSAAHPQESKAVPDRKIWEPQLVPYVHHKWHTDTSYESDSVKAHSMSLKFYQTFSYVVVPFGDIPVECLTKVVGHDQPVLFEKPFEVTQNDRVIREDSRASGDRLLDQNQEQERRELISSRITRIKKSLHWEDLNEKLCHHQIQGTKKSHRSCRVNKETRTSQSSWSLTK